MNIVAIREAVFATPQRIADAFIDPIRRRQIFGRIAETAVPAFIVTFSIWKTAVIVLGEWLLYEWLLEPLGVAGHYWERGPRDGERFKKP